MENQLPIIYNNNIESEIIKANIIIPFAESYLFSKCSDDDYIALDVLSAKYYILDLFELEDDDKETVFFEKTVLIFYKRIYTQCQKGIIPLKMRYTNDQKGNTTYWIHKNDETIFWMYFLLQYNVYPNQKKSTYERMPRFLNKSSYSQRVYEKISKDIVETINVNSSSVLGNIFSSTLIEILNKNKISFSKAPNIKISNKYTFNKLSLYELFSNQAKPIIEECLNKQVKPLKYQQKKIKLLYGKTEKKYRLTFCGYRSHIFKNLYNDFFISFKKQIENNSLNKIIKLSSLTPLYKDDESILLFINDLFKTDRIFKIFKINQLANHRIHFLSKENINRICNSNKLTYEEVGNLKKILNEQIFYNDKFINKALISKHSDYFSIFEYVFMNTLLNTEYQNDLVFKLEFDRFNLQTDFSGLINYSLIKADEIITRLYYRGRRYRKKYNNGIIEDYFSNFFDNKFLVNYFLNLEPVNVFFFNSKFKGINNNDLSKYISYLFFQAIKTLPPKIVIK